MSAAGNSPDIPILDLSGSPSEIGAAHGEHQRERIKEYVDRFIEWIVDRGSAQMSEAKLWDKWSAQVDINQQLAPTLIEEMRGIARGAGVPFERVFLLNSLLDLVRFRYPALSENFGCTTFAVARATDTGETLVGQTYDLPEMHQDYLLLLRLKPQSGPKQLVFTFSGIVGACGLNEAGIGVTINYLSPLDSGLGRLHSIVVRQILAGTNLAQALPPVVVPPRAGGAQYLVGDRDGNLLSIETTAKEHAVLYPEGNAIAHTNHYLSASLKPREYIRQDSIGSSLARYTAVRRYIRDFGDNLSLQRLQELTRNHNSYPQSICAHGKESDPHGKRTRTVAAMIHRLEQQAMVITSGCACEADYASVPL